MTKILGKNIVWHYSHVERSEREKMLRQQGCTIWFTGLPSSGKSTTAFALEHELTNRGYLAYVLDGDNVRHGLNNDLGFSAQDRQENIRRIGEVARLFADAGLITMTSFISPYRSERQLARRIHQDVGLAFIEVFVDTPVAICEERDPKGLYKKARRGELKGFTGVDDPYEPPLSPDVVIKTQESTPQEIVDQLIDFLIQDKYLKVEPKADFDQAVPLR